MKLFLIIISLFSISLAQTGGITGRVTGDGTPVPGVNILVVSTSIGGVSDENGEYRITKIPVGNQQIRFSSVGYETKTFQVEITAGKLLELNVDIETEVIEVDQIEILDQRQQAQDDPTTSFIDIEPQEARVLPGAVTDIFRTLQALPGVLAPNDFSSQLIIRGSGPDQNLIVMDDIEVFNPYRLYGVISMFNPEAVSDINLITGGFPVQYGDRLSAVLDVTNRQGDLTKPITGNLNASIVSANLVLEGKNPFDIPGSWLINSRRTYYDLIIEPFVKNAGLVEDNVTFPNFYDVQAKFAIGPFNGHKFFINGILSRDAVNLISAEDRETPDSVGVIDNSNNDLLALAWHWAPTKNTLNKLITSWYRNDGKTNFDSKLLDPSLNRNNFEDAARIHSHLIL
ncbi:MAG: TonB-dependent receptor [Melioribacteraceae bacterium]|nr:TonB-dependent receptor [Melioribacteraceae bacterium]